jgi:hypothetical protein
VLRRRLADDVHVRESTGSAHLTGETDMLSKTVLATCVAVACSMTALPSVARTIYVREAPPELRVESVPAARAGHQWVPGYWGYRSNRHVWHPGTWVRERAGYVYRQPTWVERNGRWRQQSGQWSRNDRDGDGVSNSRDRRPDDANRH